MSIKPYHIWEQDLWKNWNPHAIFPNKEELKRRYGFYVASEKGKQNAPKHNLTASQQEDAECLKKRQ
jgi:hypothetical protein